LKYGLKYLNVGKDNIHVLGKSKEKIFRIEITTLYRSAYNVPEEASFIFLESYSHLPFSLSDLVRDFVKEPKFKEFLPIPEYKHKEAYPYEWMDSFNKFDIPFLPPRETFYSRITEKTISEEEYAEAKYIFAKYCKTFKDYHDIYLTGDIVLLAEVFEEYRKISLETYKLDPACMYLGLVSFMM